MATYGKKKRLILPSFSVLRDSSSASKSKKGKIKEQGSTSFTTPTLGSSDILSFNTSRYDDSIEEMASILLDDRNLGRLSVNPEKRLSQITTAKALSEMSISGSQDSRGLPQLPQLMFNDDGTWEMRNMIASGSRNLIQSSGSEPMVQPNLTANLPKPSKDLRKESAPPIPRRSSKRKSAQPKCSSKEYGEAGHTQSAAPTVKSIEPNNTPPPNPVAPSEQSTTDVGLDVNEKIEAMIAATAALKPGPDNNILQGPFVPAKRQRLKDNKVLKKVRTAINDRLQARTVKKQYDSQRDEYLLDNTSANELQPDEDAFASSPALSSVERRLNEGDNLKKPKVYSLTGHGNIRRKQVADDGKSLRSRKSISDDPFSERPGSSRVTRTPTNFENRLLAEMSVDQTTVSIPDLPMQVCNLDELPQPQPQPQMERARLSAFAYDAESDDFFSSSPLAQSTPRIRLEPTFELDGKTILKNVPADSRSLFDTYTVGYYSGMETHTPPVAGRQEVDNKRKSSQIKDSSLPSGSYNSKRSKKHPSPSKAELESLEKNFVKFQNCLGRSESFSNFNISSVASVPLSLEGILTSRATNTLLPEAKQREKGKGFGMFLKPDLTRTAASMPNIPKLRIPKLGDVGRVRLEPREEPHFSTRTDGDGSLTDIDELQWDQTPLMR